MLNISSYSSAKSPYSQALLNKSDSENLDDIEQWRRFVDGGKQNIPSESGWKGSEDREAGYIDAMFFASNFLKNREGVKINEEVVQEGHRLCTQNVEFSCDGGKVIKEISPGEYYVRSANFYSGFQLHLGKNASQDGIRELLDTMYEDSGLCMTMNVEVEPGKFCYTTINLDWLNQNGYEQAIHLIAKRASPIRVCTQTKSVEEISCKLNALLNTFDSRMQSANLKIEKLYLIIWLIRRLVWLHPFEDANTRLFVMLLFPEWLKEHQLSPVILDNPNTFDGHSIEELMALTNKGFSNFQYVKHYQHWPPTPGQTPFFTEDYLRHNKNKNSMPRFFGLANTESNVKRTLSKL